MGSAMRAYKERVGLVITRYYGMRATLPQTIWRYWRTTSATFTAGAQGLCRTPPLPTTLTWLLTGLESIITSWHSLTAAQVQVIQQVVGSYPRPRRERSRRRWRRAFKSPCISSRKKSLSYNDPWLLFHVRKNCRV